MSGADVSGEGVQGVRVLLDALFDSGHAVAIEDHVLQGEARVEGEPVAVIGTCDRVPIGARVALRLARSVLDVMRDTPARPIVLVVNNSGQRLALWDELMGNNGCIAHLTRCLDQSRRRGHRVVGVVHDLAVSGGFMATGMATDACHAIAGAELRVMGVAAMSRVTGIAVDRLERLLADSPVIGPGAENFVRVGALHGIFEGDPRAALARTLRERDPEDDPRRRLGRERGGRVHAIEVADLVRQGRER